MELKLKLYVCMYADVDYLLISFLLFYTCLSLFILYIYSSSVLLETIIILHKCMLWKLSRSLVAIQVITGNILINSSELIPASGVHTFSKCL